LLRDWRGACLSSSSRERALAGVARLALIRGFAAFFDPPLDFVAMSG